MWRERDDRGNLMLLSGIVLTIAFVLTALTLSQVSSIERAAAADQTSPVVGEWRFVHERLATNLRTAVDPDTKIDGFNNTTMPAISAAFRTIEAGKGFDTSLRIAFGAERQLLNLAGTHYSVVSDDGRIAFTSAVDANLDDGVIWQTPCPDPTGPIGGCLGGVIVDVYLSDGVSSVTERMVFGVNQ